MRLLTTASVAVLALLAGSTIANGGSIEARFALFKEKYSRSYATPAEERRRLEIYAANMQHAGELQMRNPQATFGENEFADMSPEEFKSRHNAEKAVKAMKATKSSSKAPLRTPDELADMPQQVDWRQHGAVTPVKNQGQCGSCWAFSTTGNIEGQWFLAGNNLTSLSEQELVACDGTSDGCNGGFTGGAMDWLVQNQNGWITSEADYPYVSGNGYSPGCQLPKPHVAQIYGHHTVASNEHQMASYMAENGPLSICVDATTWQSYTGGIMTDCPNYSVDHCVLAVGYNLNASTPYWIVKNSWATSWGIDGYLYVGYGSDQCAITSTPNNALVHHSGPTPPPTPVPPTPPPTPSPPTTPAPPIAEATQKWCPDSTCSDGCSVHHFQQGVCLVNPDGVGVMIHCRENTWAIFLWYQSQSCQGEYYIQRQALDTCFPDSDGTWLYNECPSSASSEFLLNDQPPVPAGYGSTDSLPAPLQKQIAEYVREHKAKGSSHHRH